MANHALNDDEYRWFRKMAAWYKAMQHGGKGPGRTPTETFEPIVRIAEMPNRGIPGCDVVTESDGSESFTCHFSKAKIKKLAAEYGQIEDSDNKTGELGTRDIQDRGTDLKKRVINIGPWGSSTLDPVEFPPAFGGENGDAGHVPVWRGQHGEYVTHHCGYPPVTLTCDDGMDFNGGSAPYADDNDFDRTDYGLLRFKEEFIIGELAKSRVQIVPKGNTDYGGWDGPSFILKQGIWRVDLHIAVNDMRRVSGSPSTHTVSTTWVDGHSHSVTIGRPYEDTILVVGFVRQTSSSDWIAMRRMECRIDTRYPRAIVKGWMDLALSQDDYQFGLWVLPWNPDHTWKYAYSLDHRQSHVRLQCLDANPWAFTYDGWLY